MTQMTLIAVLLSLSSSWGIALAATPQVGTEGIAKAVGESAGPAQSHKQRYARAEAMWLGTGRAVDEVAGFEALRKLAREGYGRAQDKLGYFYSRGIGTQKDGQQAAFWYQQAIAAGRVKSHVSYAKLLMRQDEPAAALAQLQIADELGVADAVLPLAEYHFDKSFGAASRPQQGRWELTRLALGDDIKAKQAVMKRMSEGHRFDLDPEILLAQLVEVARDVESRHAARSAEMVLKYLRAVPDESTLTLRRELLTHPDIRAKVRAEETLYLARQTQSAQEFRTLAADVVSAVEGQSYGRALYVVSRIDKNAFVYVLQAELRARGYRAEVPSGMLNMRTLRAIQHFCRDTEITKTCRLGPMRAQVIKVIAAEMAEMPRTEITAARP